MKCPTGADELEAALRLGGDVDIEIAEQLERGCNPVARWIQTSVRIWLDGPSICELAPKKNMIMKRTTFDHSQISESFLHAYAFHMGDDEDGNSGACHGDEVSAGIFDLPSEAKKAARKAMKSAGPSRGWEWCVDRRELLHAGEYTAPHWGEIIERYSSVGGHEGKEVWGNEKSA